MSRHGKLSLKQFVERSKTKAEASLNERIYPKRAIAGEARAENGRMTPEELQEFWTRILKGKSPRIRERLLRLNPEPEYSKLVRGYYPKPMSWRRVKRLLQAGKRLPDWRRHRAADGGIWGEWGRALDLRTAQKYGWIKAAPQAEEPDIWESIRGIAPDATGDLLSEDFVRQQRDQWA